MNESQYKDIRDSFFDEIYNIASKNKNVLFITADADAYSLRRYKQDFPRQFINIGVAEQNMITVASGLALSSKKVYIYAIIPFITMRCFEHIKVNICSMNLPVAIIGAGAGLSFGNDGPTHHAVNDISVMRTLPEITIFNPCDSISASKCGQISFNASNPTYIRLDKGQFPSLYDNNDNYLDGMKIIRNIKDINIISTGFMTHRAVEVADKLSEHSIDVGIIDIYRLKPVNVPLLLKTIDKTQKIVTLEENSIIGGIGSIVSEILNDNQKNIQLKRIAVQDEQCFNYGTREWLHRKYLIDNDSIVKRMLNW